MINHVSEATKAQEALLHDVDPSLTDANFAYNGWVCVGGICPGIHIRAALPRNRRLRPSLYERAEYSAAD